MNKAVRFASVSTAAAALVAAPLAVAPSAQAAPYTDDALISLNTTIAGIGAQIRILGQGFNEGELVFVKLTSPTTTLLKIRVGSNGQFNETAVVPQTDAGEHMIKAKGKQSKAVATAPLMVQD